MKLFLTLCLGFFLSFYSRTQYVIDLDLVYEYEVGTVNTFTVLEDKLGRDYFYAAIKAGGLQIFNSSDIENSQMIVQLPIWNFDWRHVNNLYQVDTILYLSLGNFLGLGSQLPGMAIVNVSNPEVPVVMDWWVLEPEDNVVRGAPVVEVRGDYAYLGATNNGLIILDVSDKSNIQFVSKYVPDINFPVESPGFLQTPAARGLTVVNDSLLALCYDAGGLRLINISDKYNPFEVGRYINQSVNHVQAFNNVVVNGNLAYVAVDYCGLEILDISDSTNIVQVGWLNPYNCHIGPEMWAQADGHLNELVYLADLEQLFISSGDAELLVVDVSEPSNPTLTTSYGEAHNENVTWGLDAGDEYVYLAYIIANIDDDSFPFTSDWSGVKVLSYNALLSTPENEVESNQITIYPNPFTDKLTISNIGSLNNGACTIEVHSIDGQQVYMNQFDVNSDTFTFEINVPSGIYFVSVKNSDNQLVVQKMIR